MPAMRMTFPLAGKADASVIHSGDKVTFELVSTGDGAYQVR